MGNYLINSRRAPRDCRVLHNLGVKFGWTSKCFDIHFLTDMKIFCYPTLVLSISQMAPRWARERESVLVRTRSYSYDRQVLHNLGVKFGHDIKIFYYPFRYIYWDTKGTGDSKTGHLNFFYNILFLYIYC